LAHPVDRKVESSPIEVRRPALLVRRGLQWPDADCRRAVLIYGTGVSLLWLAVYGGADWFTDLHNYRIPLQTSVDLAIPFVPAGAIFYLSLFPMLWLAPFILHTPQQCQAFAEALAAAILIAGIGFVLIPAAPIEIRSVATGLFGPLFHFADWVNLKNNLFPSLHVALAVVSAVSFSRSQSAAVGLFFWLWAAMIALSTLLTRQHYIIDIVAGGFLGTVVAHRRPLHV
jgi:membrane-associated phospholipid phosphatase